MPRRIANIAFALLAGAMAAAACDRNIEAYEDVPVEQPDLSRIFPEGAQQARRGAPVMPAAENPAAENPAAENPAAAKQAPQSASPRALRGVVTLAPGAQNAAPPGAVLFVIARAGPGPPLAVLRIAAPQFPQNFALGPEHRMLRQRPFAGELTLSARLDFDGNALSRAPGELAGSAPGNYAPGASGINIVLSAAP